MTDESTHSEAQPGGWLNHLRRGTQALCLIAMVAAFVTLGALGYQGWRVTHNPFRNPKCIAKAPSPEVAAWAAEVYRLEKREHLFFTGLYEVALIIVSAGAWAVYRKVDHHLQGLHRLKNPLPERPRRVAPPTEPAKP